MTRLPTAKELDLWDVELPEGMALSVMPPAQEHIYDPIWWDQGGRDPLDQRFIFRLVPGSERTAKLKKIVEGFPRYGPKMYEKCAISGRADIIRELLALGASMDIDEAKAPGGGADDDDDSTDAKDGEDNNNGVDSDDDYEDIDNDDVPLAKMEPAILAAADKGHLECVTVLVEEAGIDVNLTDDDGRTALLYAALRGHLDMATWLLSKDAHINFNREEINDVEAAFQGGNADLARLLLTNKQSAISKFKVNEDALRYAAASGNIEMVKLVIEYAKYPPLPASESTNVQVRLPKLSHKQKENIYSSIAFAVGKGSLELVQLLLSYLTPRLPDGSFEYVKVRDDVRSDCFNSTEDAMSDGFDDPVLFQTIWETLLFPVNKLTHTKAQKEKYDDWLNRRLISASAEGCPKIARLLCEKYGANVNHISHKYFSTPLGRAAGSGANPLPGRLEVAEYLLSQPEIDIHLATGEYSNGPTPLALVITEGQRQIEMVRLLLEHGGPVEEIDSKMVQKLAEHTDDGKVTLCIMVSHDESRFPVSLMLKDDREEASRGKSFTRDVELVAEKTELEAILSKLQIRKSDSALAEHDPKKRLLNGDKITGGRADLGQALRTQLKDLDFDQMFFSAK